MFILLLINFGLAQNCSVCCSDLQPRAQLFYKYYQDSGRLVGGEGEWAIDTYGYSGNNTEGVNGRNNPFYQCESNIGPAPATSYVLGNCSDLMHVNATRPCSFPMNPLNESEMCGRFGIWLHGCQCCSDANPTCDISSPPCGTCSEGCVIISKIERVKLRTGDIIVVEHNDPKVSNAVFYSLGMVVLMSIFI